MFSFSKQSNIKQLRGLIQLLKSKITNPTLLKEITHILYTAEENDTILDIGNFEVTITDKKTKDTFYLTISDNEIKTVYTSGNNLHHEGRKISFDNNIITIAEEEANIFKYNFNNYPTGDQKKNKLRIYKDNNLIYIREFQLSTTTSIESYLSSSSVIEIFINQKHQAAKKETAICKHEGNTKTGIVYYKTDFYDTPTFSNPEERLYSTNFIPSSEEEFMEFLKETNKSESNPLLKKRFTKIPS